MKRSKIARWIAGAGASLMFAFAVFATSLGGGYLYSGLNEKGETAPSGVITAEAATAVTYPDGKSELGRFPDGYSYVYSDKDKIAGYRGRTLDTDITTVVVDSSESAGTQKNPYVIASEEDWEYFVKRISLTANNFNYGLGKYFVLASDLDFGQTDEAGNLKYAFHPAYYFQGTFYGLGRSLKNITVDTWKYYNNSTTTLSNMGGVTYGYGVFGRINGAVITDLIVDNYSYRNMPTGSSSAPRASAMTVGGVAGFNSGTSCILNCHTSGEMTSTLTYSSNEYSSVGGIVGYSLNSLTLYRCSAEMPNIVINHTRRAPITGGMIGEIGNSASAKIYDCVANVHNSSSTESFSTVAVGWTWSSVSLVLENLVGTVTLTTTGSVYGGGIVALANGLTAPTIKNVYGDLKSGGKVMYASIGNAYPASTLTTISNVNIVKKSTDSYVTSFVSNCGYCLRNMPASTVSVHESNDDMLAKAKAGVGASSSYAFYSGIWDASKIGGTYDPENSPVRNPLKVTVSYFEHKTGGDVQYPIQESTEPVEVKAGQGLYTPAAKEHRTFLGWTTDKTGASEPFTEVPADLYGDNKLYAVWELNEPRVSITATGANSDFAFDPAAKTASMTYNGKGITLTAHLTAEGMNDPDITYRWSKDREEIATAGTAQTYKVNNVADSGKYTVKLTFRSSSEPLFRGEAEVRNADGITATIHAAPLYFVDGVIGFADGAHAYSGAPNSTALPVAEITNGDGDAVEGELKWSIGTSTFNSSASVMREEKGKLYETKKILFLPSDPNYGTEWLEFEGEFLVEYLTFTFLVPDYMNLKLVYNLEYNQTYTYNNVADMFEELFAPYMNDESLGGQAPAFVLGTDDEGNEILSKINDYRKINNSGDTAAYERVKESRELTVRFEGQFYTVTYDPKNNGASEIITQKNVGHNMRLTKPVDPVNGEKLFLGWYYKITDDKGNEEVKAWDFSQDRITRELSFFARWLDATDFVELRISFTDDAEFIAREEVNPNHLIVKAVFRGTDEETGTEVERESILTYGAANGYEITYRKGGVLHVNLDDDKNVIKEVFKITYAFKGEAIEPVPVSVTVSPLRLDTDIIREELFKDFTMVVDESATPDVEMNLARVKKLIPQISGVTYEYLDPNDDPIALENIKAVGEYKVYAHFTTSSEDYSAPSIWAKLTIIDTPLYLNVTWDAEEFTYNGKVQVPKPAFTDEFGKPVNPNYYLADINGKSVLDEGHLEDVEAILANTNAKPNYTVKIVITDLGYSVTTGMDTKNFKILKAIVKIPTQTAPIEYRGKAFNLNELEESYYTTYFENFDKDILEAYEGIFEAKDAGTYGATLRLKNSACAEWETGGSAPIDFTWQIKKATLRVSWEGSTELIYTGLPQSPKVNSLYTIYGDDINEVDLDGDLIFSGDNSAIEIGEYKITVAIRSGVQWAKNYELNDTAIRAFSIIPDGATILYVEWVPESTVLEYNGAAQRPTFVIKLGNAEGRDVTDQYKSYIAYKDQDGKIPKYAGDYVTTATLIAAVADQYYLKGKLSCPYTIKVNEAGEGADPDTEGPGNDGDDKKPSDGTLNIPLWQVIVSAICTVLFVVCLAKSYGNLSKAKAAKNEAKELASQSYYGFVPLPLLAAGTFLGMGETPWTIIAGVTAGLFLLSAILLFITSKKRKAAELTLKREQARIAEEKEFAREEENRRRDEEQQRRDNELKMMFAAMQQGGGYGQAPAFGYEDMQNMITSAMTAMLPAMQQMQALPPAQSDTSGYAQPGYVSPEAEMLREQLARQEERMARQEELINQLLQNQAAPAYEEEEEVEDDISWLGESDEIVSLEESYGALSDEGKRAYYEIGSYIMSKPRTSQNDGRYAVLFKYRRRTLFKLAIKDDAPVLYYPAGSGRGEVRIADEASLNVARSMIDQSVAMVDRELN